MPDDSRRHFVGRTLATFPLCAGLSRAGAGTQYKMYSWLACATISVRANQRQAMQFAQSYGFQAVEPLSEELARMTDQELRALLDELHVKNLRWGVATFRLNFHLDEAEFSAGVKRPPGPRPRAGACGRDQDL